MSSEDLLRTLLVEGEGLAVFNVPSPRSKLLGKLLPKLAEKLRSLAAVGSKRLILDIARTPELTSEHLGLLVKILRDADQVGIHTAICTPHRKAIEGLRLAAETRKAPIGVTVDAARQCLEVGRSA